MKHSERIYQEDLELLDSINRMSRQLHFHANDRHAAMREHEGQRLQLTVEEFEEQMEAIRLSHETHNHKKW